MAQVMPNYGLLTSMANGLKEGLIGFQTIQEAKRNNQLMQMQMQKEGMQQDENGNVSYSPEMQGLIQQKRQSELAQYSPMSTEQRQNIKQLTGYDVPENVTGAQYKQTLEPLAIAKMHEQATKNLYGVKHEEQVSEKQKVADQKELKDLQDEMDANKARAGNFAKLAGMHQSAERLRTLFSQFPDDNVPKTQTTELATGVAGLISGGSPQSQHQIDQIVPQSMRGNAEAIAGWFTNNPRGLEQQQFIHALRDTTNREDETALGLMKQIQAQRLGRHSDLYKRNPDAYMQVLQNYGFDPEDINERGQYKGLVGGKIEKKSGSQQFPMVVRKGNKQATVNSAAELKEAQSEGFQ